MNSQKMKKCQILSNRKNECYHKFGIVKNVAGTLWIWESKLKKIIIKVVVVFVFSLRP